MKLPSFEYSLFRTLPSSLDSVLIACSGGVDSVALLELFYQIQRVKKIRVEVIHVHHGKGDNSAFRDQAAQFVSQLAEVKKLPLHICEYSGGPRNSEAELRQIRLQFLREIRNKQKIQYVAMGHHRDDLFETRLIRMIRGVGSQGLKSMSIRKGYVLRPFLNMSRNDVMAYAKMRHLQWKEDPTNASNDYFRNWLRNDWLPQLENKRPGSIQAWSRSLHVIARQKSDLQLSDYVDDVGLRRDRIQELSEFDQGRVVAYFFKKQALEGYTRSHIQELLKRLDSPKNELTFRLMKCVFRVDTKHIRVVLD